jgi:hypothetical protein
MTESELQKGRGRPPGIPPVSSGPLSDRRVTVGIFLAPVSFVLSVWFQHLFLNTAHRFIFVHVHSVFITHIWFCFVQPGTLVLSNVRQQKKLGHNA